MRFVRLAASLAVLAVILVLGAFGAGPVPPLGSLLDPWNGIWAAARTASLSGAALAAIPGLADTVRVVYDHRAVPHIFAHTADDAYRALGYVVARDRLFQLEMQTRATGGTLTELVGSRALPLDRSQRALGLAASAEREWAAMDSTSSTARALRAYAAGVNAWIDGLSAADRPLEYHLLGARPMRWQPQYTLYLMKRMGYTLAFNNDERARQHVADLVGDSAADALLPVHSPIQLPIQPGKGPYPRYDFRPLPPPHHPAPGLADRPERPRVTHAAYAVRGGGVSHEGMPRGEASGGGAAAGREGTGAGPWDWVDQGGDDVGSNNWAVSPRRSATHHALLAGDPHLDLTLPSIWYEVQLVVPGVLDVYGVTIPGVPGIVIGFNRDVAWSFTNTGNDVLDLYTETLDDPQHPTQYRLDGAWHHVERRIETYRGRRGEVLAVDTLYATGRGPLLLRGKQPVSMRWLVLEGGGVDALLAAQRAKSAVEWLRLMRSYRTPAQNGLVADRGGAIAIRSTGGFPIRPGNGRGDVTRDGSTSASDWTGFWPVPRYPFARDPARGFLVSANQEPKDPRVDPGYLGSNWPAPWRAMRITQLLAADSSVTVDDMRRFQTDPGSARADAFLPKLLAIGRHALPHLSGKDSAAVGMAIGLLAQWDGRYTRTNDRAVLFELVMDELQDHLWDELAPGPAGLRRSVTPGEAVLLEALADSTSVWWDDRRTPRVETRDDIVAASLAAALERAEHLYGAPTDSLAWRWDRVHHVNIYHLLGLPSLSALNLAVSGGPSTISPSEGAGRHGASWRMVVELGPQVTGWGIYPGGQSGNPVSPHYEDQLDAWRNGRLDSLLVPRNVQELGAEQSLARLTLVPARGRLGS
jgi:penicillin G amidase